MIKLMDLLRETYKGDVGIMELVQFYEKATEEQKKQFSKLLNAGRNSEAWELVKKVTGTKIKRI
jgi:hypothetical protein